MKKHLSTIIQGLIFDIVDRVNMPTFITNVLAHQQGKH